MVVMVVVVVMVLLWFCYAISGYGGGGKGGLTKQNIIVENHRRKRAYPKNGFNQNGGG